MLQRLVDAGNTVLVIEHNLDVIKQADWVVDLGPEGGEAGGELIAAGTPEEVAEVEGSFTGQYLREVLAPARARRRLAHRIRARCRELNAIGIVASDTARSIQFYRVLGLPFPETPDEGHVRGRHAERRLA